MMIRPDKPITRITIAQIGCFTIKRKKKIRVSGKYELRNSIPRISTVGIARILSHWQCAPCCTSIKSVSDNCSGFPCTNEYSTGFQEKYTDFMPYQCYTLAVKDVRLLA